MMEISLSLLGRFPEESREEYSARILNHLILLLSVLYILFRILFSPFSEYQHFLPVFTGLIILGLINLFFIKFKWFKLLKINLVFIPVFLVLFLPLILKYPVERYYFSYPTTLLTASILATLVIHYKKEKALLITAIVYYLGLLLLSDKIIEWASVTTSPMYTLIKEFYLFYKVIPLVSFVFIHFSVFLLQNITHHQQDSLLRSTKEVQQQYSSLMDRKEEIEIQRNALMYHKELIDSQKKILMNSITSAKHIQNSILPSDARMKELLPTHFVFNKPKDIVSGDFYWINEDEGKVLLALADCTGHGVPGAFISILGISILNDVFAKHSNLPTGSFMNEIRENVIINLNQTGKQEDIKIGMDMSLIKIDRKKQILYFTGANHNLFMVRSGEFEQYRGDRMPVSVNIGRYHPYNTHSIEYSPGDMIYLLSDGYPDQFGGERRKKFGYPRFKKLLTEIHEESLKQQYLTLIRKLDEWQYGLEQIDDILIIGVKL